MPVNKTTSRTSSANVCQLYVYQSQSFQTIMIFLSFQDFLIYLEKFFLINFKFLIFWYSRLSNISKKSNPFHANVLLPYPLKISGNQRFSDVFRGIKERLVAWNEMSFVMKQIDQKHENYSLWSQNLIILKKWKNSSKLNRERGRVGRNGWVGKILKI